MYIILRAYVCVYDHKLIYEAFRTELTHAEISLQIEQKIVHHVGILLYIKY